MRRFVSLLIGLASLAARSAMAQGPVSDLDGLPAVPKPIPVVATAGGQEFEDAEVIGRSGDVLHIRHSTGVVRLSINSFDNANLDLLFPGYLARVNDRKANAEAKEQRRIARVKEESQLVEKKLRDAIDEALHPADPEALKKEPLVAVLVFGREVYETEDTPQLRTRIVNRSSKPVYLITAHSDSTDPHCALSFRDSAGHVGWLLKGGGCGLGDMRKLRVDAFVLVRPSEAFAPMEKFQSIDLRPIFQTRFDSNGPIQQSGKFAAQFSYSTTNRRIRDYEWRIADGVDPVVDPQIQRLFDQVPAVKLQSKPVEITLPPVDRLKKLPLNGTF